ncbi:MAG: EF-P lysine aminoacylase GenX [Dehalococcoidales bacterium]|nr:EF-P lysine aminoacylase GenX [Dehalococcoidales bacterium]
MSLEESSRLSRIKSNLKYRARMLDGMRAFFCREGFLEVETPLRVPAIAPERFIWPYTSEGWFLSTSPELQMKRLLSAGYERIFQVCRCFRRDERGSQHNPEFTMLEWYRAGADYRQILADTENLVLSLSRLFDCGTVLPYRGRRIDLSPPWPRISVSRAFSQWAGWDPVRNFDALRFDEDLVNKVIPAFPFDRPTIILDYPAGCASLARLKPGCPGVAERAEVFIGGLEIANGYSELNIADEQEKRFRLEMEEMQLNGIPCVLPEKFLESIRNMPECTGMALGIDRLAMLMCDSASIDDVIAFPSDML